jgi:hypothetical protein
LPARGPGLPVRASNPDPGGVTPRSGARSERQSSCRPSAAFRTNAGQGGARCVRLCIPAHLRRRRRR